MSKDFHLKRFSIRQQHAAMKVGTDAILLGAWLGSLDLDPKNFLDVGTGTGIIALMAAQHFPQAQGQAIEIDKDALLDAQYNVAQSPFSSQIEVIAGDFLEQNFLTLDLIVSNPPYFGAEGIHSPEESRRRARHESNEGLNLRTLMQKAASLLSRHGVLALVTPHEREADLRLYATECLLRPKAMTHVYSSPKQQVRLLSLWERLDTSATHYKTTQRASLIIRDRYGNYTEEYKRLTQEFLLQTAK